MKTDSIQNSLELSTQAKNLVRLSFLFNVTLGILLICTLLLGGCSSTTSMNWHSVALLSPELKSAALSNTTLTDTTKIAVASLAGNDGSRLYFFNYNSPEICGKLGCLYTAYLDEGKHRYRRVFSAYLHQGLPAGKTSSISVSNFANGSRLPCFDLRQVRSRLLDELTYCFDGNAYRDLKQVERKIN